MAHAIETHNGEAAFVSAREDAWHQLGTVLPDTFDAATALEKAHLANWNVRKEETRTASGLIVPNTYAVVRDNPFIPGQVDVLTRNGQAVGEGYTPIQNESHVELLNALVDESGAHFETAGSLHDGADVFVTMKMPEHMMVGGQDEVGIYLAALNNHVGTAAFRFLVTPVRIVCANTQAAAIREAKAKFSIYHSTGAMSHMEEARQALGLTFKYIDAFQDEANHLLDQEFFESEFAALTGQLVGKVDENTPKRTARNIVETTSSMMWSFLESPTNEGIRNTKWCAYQAIAEWADHLAPVRGAKTDADAATARALRVVDARPTDLKFRAWDLLTVG